MKLKTYGLAMEKFLKECKVGDNVIIWCIGTRKWDDQQVKILDSGVSILIKVQYESGRISHFSPSTWCKEA